MLSILIFYISLLKQTKIDRFVKERTNSATWLYVLNLQMLSRVWFVIFWTSQVVFFYALYFSYISFNFLGPKCLLN